MLSEYGPLDRISSPRELQGAVESESVDLKNRAMFAGAVWRRLIVVRRRSLEGRTKNGKYWVYAGNGLLKIEHTSGQ